MTERTPSELALLGGRKAIQADPGDMFTWPIVTEDDEAAVLEVLRRRGMSGLDVTRAFEEDYAAWQGTRHALGFSCGTAALEAAMFGCKVGVGDEIIAPAMTYWASCLPAFNLGATIVFADIDPETHCIDAGDIEHRITERTKAIVPVHYSGHPCDMDRIMEIAERHGLKVIEDNSHAQGGLYKGTKCGAIGHVSAASMMSGKSLAVGEAGMLATDDREIYDRAVAWGHYARFSADKIETDYLKPWAGLPLGGHKYRMHQLSAAMGRVQLKHYDARLGEIDKAMTTFWDRLEGVPGLRAPRVAKDSGSTMAGWYFPHGTYDKEALGGLSVSRFCEAVRAEGFNTTPGLNKPLHLHPLLNEIDVYGHGKPTRIANADRDLRQPKGSLPVAEETDRRTFMVPWFKHFRPEIIDEYAAAYKKVAAHHGELLEGDEGDPENIGGWTTYRR
jgi:dTDP-4-amino-4,6-dideoxygalactose transaminase